MKFAIQFSAFTLLALFSASGARADGFKDLVRASCMQSEDLAYGKGFLPAFQGDLNLLKGWAKDPAFPSQAAAATRALTVEQYKRYCDGKDSQGHDKQCYSIDAASAPPELLAYSRAVDPSQTNLFEKKMSPFLMSYLKKQGFTGIQLEQYGSTVGASMVDPNNKRIQVFFSPFSAVGLFGNNGLDSVSMELPTSTVEGAISHLDYDSSTDQIHARVITSIWMDPTPGYIGDSVNEDDRPINDYENQKMPDCREANSLHHELAQAISSNFSKAVNVLVPHELPKSLNGAATQAAGNGDL
jgi:hypothetical protein